MISFDKSDAHSSSTGIATSEASETSAETPGLSGRGVTGGEQGPRAVALAELLRREMVRLGVSRAAWCEWMAERARQRRELEVLVVQRRIASPEATLVAQRR